FGELLVVSSEKGICSIRFIETHANIEQLIKQYFSKAQLKNQSPIWHQQIAKWFEQVFSEHVHHQLPLNLARSPSQRHVSE
ncbi:cysteine methyltransferase, partial [Acinetobacter nosocomialis]